MVLCFFVFKLKTAYAMRISYWSSDVCSSVLVHYYFKNREQLIDVMVAERVAPVIAFVWAPAAAPLSSGGAPPDARAVVAQVVTRIVQCAAERPWLPPLWMREVVNEEIGRAHV